MCVECLVKGIKSEINDDDNFSHTPLALSNFLPFDLTYGLVWDPLAPGGGPKCFLASLDLGPLKSKVFVPIQD